MNQSRSFPYVDLTVKCLYVGPNVVDASVWLRPISRRHRRKQTKTSTSRLSSESTELQPIAVTPIKTQTYGLTGASILSSSTAFNLLILLCIPFEVLFSFSDVVMPKLLSTPSPPQPIRCLLQSPRRSISLSSPRQHFVSSPVRPLAQPRHGILSDFWPTPVSPTLFSQTHHESSIDGLNGGPQNDHKPPDERILKLGKSTCACPWGDCR
jgi:hypothetical protein